MSPAQTQSSRSGSMLVSAAAVLLVACSTTTMPSTVSGYSTAGGPPAFTTDTGTYVSTYDHLDIGRLLKNEKLVSAYIKCFTNEGQCTIEGRQVKAILLPEIIRTVCGKCSPRQKEMARQVLKHVYYTRNADFNRIMELYDTEGKRDQIIAFMNQHK